MTTNEEVQYNDLPVKLMLYPAIVFMVLGMTMGVFIAYNTFIFPDYFSGEYVHFGKLRPIHVTNVTLLWLLSADMGLFFYFVPRLCGVSVWSPRLAYIAIALWWPSLIIGNWSYPWNTNFGWEFAESPNWVGIVPNKMMFTIAFVLMSFNLYMTIANRRYNKMYVSLWYVMGTLFWTPFTWVVGTYMVDWVPGGISRVNVSFFYLHNLVGMVFTPMGIATAYYFLPKLTNQPIYSHKLSMIGFWSIAFVYSWIGAHHMMHGPISQWLQTTSIIFSIWLFIPVFTVVHNLFMTLLKNWREYIQSPAVRFLMMGNIFYLITCVQGPLMALRNVNEITSKTDWVIGHSHVSLYATFTYFAFAGVYQVIPTITKKPLWSYKLAQWHFGLNFFGSIPFIAALWVGGYLQGLQWATWSEGATYAQMHSNISILPFLQTVADMRLWWILRGTGGLIILIGNILFLFNMYNTIVLQPEKKRVPNNHLGYAHE